MSTSFYAINNGQYCGIYLSWNNFEHRCLSARSFERFGEFADAFEWITDQEPIDDGPPERRCRWSYSTPDGIPLVFTDGAAINNGPNCEAAGYGIFWGRSHRYNVCAALIDETLTSNRAELMAVMVAIRQANERGNNAIHICTDSQYAITCFENMRYWKERGWRRSNGRQVMNVDYLEQWINFLDQTEIRVTMEHVAAHQDDDDDKSRGNNAADWLAERGAELGQLSQQ